jgi:hypothetical protein
MTRAYWLDLFTVETWQEFLAHGGDVSGFKPSRHANVERIKPGDYLLCYLTKVSKWSGILEVTREAFYDEERIWSSGVFPWRVRVRVVIAVPPEYGIPVLEMRDALTVFRNLPNPSKWQGPFLGSPTRWKAADGEAVMRALEVAALQAERDRSSAPGSPRGGSGPRDLTDSRNVQSRRALGNVLGQSACDPSEASPAGAWRQVATSV